MQLKKIPLIGHLVILFCFCAIMVGIWSVPALLSGYSYDIFHSILARNVADTGIFSMNDAIGRVLSTSLISDVGVLTSWDGRLNAWIIAWFSQWIAWSDTVGWTVFAASIFATSLIFLWLCVHKLFDSTVAWSAVIITALLPVYWREAVWLDNYNFALLFLFASFAAFVWLQEKHRYLAFISAGILFGLSIASKDVFLIFMPWYVVAYVWHFRKQWNKSIIPAVLFIIFTGGVYLLPYTGDIVHLGYPVNQNLARVWPGSEEIANDNYLHLYPDPYTYYFDRERFDAEYLEQLKSAPVIARLQNEKLTLAYGLEDGFLQSLKLGTFLFAQDIPRFFQRHNTGGVFLWLFILPGIFFLFRRDKRLAWWAVGLVGTSYAIIRFGLGYERDHFMDVGWILAIFAALGVQSVSSVFSKTQKKWKQFPIVVFLIVVIALQLLQANRFEFAERYRRTNVPETMAWVSALRELPEDAIVALHEHPSRIDALALLTDRTFAMFRSETVDRLAQEGKLWDVFEQYGVTHAFLYSEEQVRQISKYSRNVQIVETLDVSDVLLGSSVNMNFLLHLIR